VRYVKACGLALLAVLVVVFAIKDGFVNQDISFGARLGHWHATGGSAVVAGIAMIACAVGCLWKARDYITGED
jgi:hypothetical protein